MITNSLALLSGGSVELEEVQQLSSWFVKQADRVTAFNRRVRSLPTKSPQTSGHQVIKSIVTNVLGLTWHELVSRRVHVHVELASDLPLVNFDPAEIQQDLFRMVVTCMDEIAQLKEAKRVMVIRAVRDTPLEREAVTLSVQYSSTADAASMAERDSNVITVF